MWSHVFEFLFLGSTWQRLASWALPELRISRHFQPSLFSHSVSLSGRTFPCLGGKTFYFPATILLNPDSYEKIVIWVSTMRKIAYIENKIQDEKQYKTKSNDSISHLSLWDTRDLARSSLSCFFWAWASRLAFSRSFSWLTVKTLHIITTP